jgi:hypothetical protein
MTNKPLPEGAIELVELIYQEQQIIVSTLQTCIHEGLDRQNFRLVKLLLPRVRTRAEAIKATCRRIQRFADGPKRRGRLPKWVEVVLEVTALADRVIQCVDLAGAEVESNRWVTIDHLLRNRCQDFNQRIGEGVSAIVPAYMLVERVEIPQMFYEKNEG